jgi:hypothetical protein
VDIWVVRICGTNTTELHDSRPCTTCVNTLKKYNVRKIWYIFNGKLCCEYLKNMETTYSTRCSIECNTNYTLKLI